MRRPETVCGGGEAELGLVMLVVVLLNYLVRMINSKWFPLQGEQALVLLLSLSSQVHILSSLSCVSFIISGSHSNSIV